MLEFLLIIASQMKMKHGRSDHGLDEGTWDYLESKLLEKTYDDVLDTDLKGAFFCQSLWDRILSRIPFMVTF